MRSTLFVSYTCNICCILILKVLKIVLYWIWEIVLIYFFPFSLPWIICQGDSKTWFILYFWIFLSIVLTEVSDSQIPRCFALPAVVFALKAIVERSATKDTQRSKI